MKKTLLLISICSSLIVYSQSYKLAWGEDVKMKTRTTDIDIVTADNSGLYLLQGRIARNALTGAYSPNYRLYKFDKNFAETYEKDFKKDLRGLDYNSMQPLGNDLF